MISPRAFNHGLRDVFRIGVRSVYAYRMWLYLGVLQVFFQLVLLRAIWEAVYGAETHMEGVSAGALLTYLTITGLLSFMIAPAIDEEIQERIEQGQVAIDLVRPIGFIRQMVVLEAGRSAGRWLALIVVVPGLLLIGSLDPPDAVTFGWFVLSVILAFSIAVLLWLLVGLSAFWLLNLSGMGAVLNIVSSFFAGFLIPLWFMPGPLRIIAEILPFQSYMFLPAAIYVEQTQGTDLVRALALQVVWIGILSYLVTFIWKRAQRRIVVQGG